MCAVMGVTGCRQLFGIDTPALGDGGGGSDTVGPMTDAHVDAPDGSPGPLGPWGTPTRVFPLDGLADDDPTVTGDLLELYFNRGAADVYVSKRASVTDAWGTPTLVAELGNSDTGPEVSLDGLTMYLSSNRAGTLGLYDVMISTRATRADLWSTPRVRDRARIRRTTRSRAGPTADALEIAFSSNRLGTYDLFSSTRATLGSTWSSAGRDRGARLQQARGQRVPHRRWPHDLLPVERRGQRRSLLRDPVRSHHRVLRGADDHGSLDDDAQRGRSVGVSATVTCCCSRAMSTGTDRSIRPRAEAARRAAAAATCSDTGSRG